MIEQRKTILQDAMVQFCILIFSLLIVFLLFNYQSSPPTNVINGGVGAELPYLFATTPILLIILAIIVDALINICLYVLIKKWRELPLNKLAYEKQLAKQHEKENVKKATDNKFKQLKIKAEQGKKLTQEEEKWLKNYMGLIWYASLERKTKNKDKPK
jgi:hypothetical protein